MAVLSHALLPMPEASLAFLPEHVLKSPSRLISVLSTYYLLPISACDSLTKLTHRGVVEEVIRLGAVRWRDRRRVWLTQDAPVAAETCRRGGLASGA